MDEDDAASFASIDDLEGEFPYIMPYELTRASLLDDEGKTHFMELSKLAEKDPEFYKYLQENDQELLKFDPNDEKDEAETDLEMEAGILEDEEKQTPILTATTLKGWQKALLEVFQ